jgi:hypothetical protein
MNELIAQLAEQAAQESALLENETNLEVYVGDEKSYQVPASFIEAFAKLIVREASTLAYDGPNGILEHFGVKE